MKYFPMCIGFNCSLGAEHIHPYLQQLSSTADCYTIAYPNAGLPNSMFEYDETPQQFQRAVQQLIEHGLVNIVGGCCGTTPHHIKLISNTLDQLHKSNTLKVRGRPTFQQPYCTSLRTPEN
jgi:5-methyltetrahydrofolate--homocysteine methyltransferase